LLILAASLVGLSWQQAGWMSHDFCHHQVFQRSRTLNTIGSLISAGVYLGYSPSWWKDKHNRHHAVPNVYGQDPDIDTMPILSWTPQDFVERKPNELVKNQSWLFLPVFHAAHWNWLLQSFVFAYTQTPISEAEETKYAPTPAEDTSRRISKFLNPQYPSYSIRTRKTIQNAFVERFALVIHHAALIGLVYSSGVTLWQGISFLLLSHMICGILLAIVFALNHSGMPIVAEEDADKMGFYELQVVTGRDVTNHWFVNWFTGGLNFQIEHHLFPSLPRSRYVELAPKVQSICERYNVPYHSTAFWSGLVEVIRILSTVEKIARKDKSL